MEQDDEISGKGNSLTTPFRMYNPRLGRWMSTDPITHPQYSPYSAFDNNPIYYSDPSGANSETDPPTAGDNDANGSTGTSAPNGGAYSENGGVSSGATRYLGCGKNGEDTYGIPGQGGVSDVAPQITGKGNVDDFQGIDWDNINSDFNPNGVAYPVKQGPSIWQRFDSWFNISGVHLTDGDNQGMHPVSRKGVGDETSLDIKDILTPGKGGKVGKRFSPTSQFNKLPLSQQTKIYKDLNLMFKVIDVTLNTGNNFRKVGEAFGRESGLNKPVLHNGNAEQIKDTLANIH